MNAKQITNQKHSVLITGDVTIDNYIYEGRRDSSYKENERGVSEIIELGGACYTHKILNKLIEKATKDEDINRKKETPDARFNITENWEINASYTAVKRKVIWQTSYSLWKPYFLTKDKYVFRVFKELGYGDQQPLFDVKKIIPNPVVAGNDLSDPKILIIDDAGFQFRLKSNENNWLLNNKIEWIILKMSRPLACGDLWEELLDRYSEKLIVVVSADELRAEDIKITKGSSWEQTIEDTRNVLFTSHKFSDLTKCRHLILSFTNDGALWLDNTNRKVPSAKLLCDTGRAENEWSEKIPGNAFGYMSCLTAALAYSMIYRPADNETLDLATGIESGLSAMRNLLEKGHGDIETIDSPLGFPADRIAEEIRKPTHALATIAIPWIHPDKIKETSKWMIAEMLQRSPALKEEVSLKGLANLVVLYGVKILDSIPYAKFKALTTIDRSEIETLRNIRHLMIEYRDNPKANKPISFGIFGPPGAGKSFGVRQIANEVFDEKSWLEFNLSQFSTGSLSELYGAFHLIRDKVLAGIVPVVFMDEFDSKKYEWLQYLLSPMQDGEFQEGQLKHTIGKCIFIFAGATSHTFDSFGMFNKDADGKVALKDFILKKGPDFKSRLDAYINVLGPNQRTLIQKSNEPDPTDISYPLRRAIFIASKIKYQSYLPAPIDLGLINALLGISKYIHGARSLDKLVSILRSADGNKLCRANIPSDTQLAMYVDPAEFKKLLIEPQTSLHEIPIEELAKAIHYAWQMLSKENAVPITKEFDKLFIKLDGEGKEDNRAAARRIQDILASVNLKIEKIKKSNILDKVQQQTILSHILQHIELLSALEHNGWWMQRLKVGWKYGEIRDNKRKIHHLLKPYSELPNFEKEKDRNSIKNYQHILENVGYQINWIK